MAWNWLLSLMVMSANAWKSFSSIALIIFSVLNSKYEVKRETETVTEDV